MNNLRSKKFLSVLFAGLFLTFGILQLTVYFSVQYLLEQEATKTSLNWKNFLIHKLEYSNAITEKQPQLLKTQLEKENFQETIHNILETGNLEEIDIIDPECKCYLSFSRENHSKVTTEKHNALHLNLKWQTYNEASSIYKEISELDEIALDIELDHSIDDPIATAQIYHPFVKNAQTQYFIRMRIDLEDKYLGYLYILYLGTGLIITCLFIAIALPIYQYFSTSNQIKTSEKRARYLAMHDDFTGLYNRNGIMQIVNHSLKSSEMKEKEAFFIILDLKNFKNVNDYYGYKIGDKILQKLTKELKKKAKDNITLGRLSGDEFVVIVDNVNTNIDNIDNYFQVPKSVSTSVEAQDAELTVEINAAVVKYPEHGDTLHGLLRNADLALQYVKASDNYITEYNAQMGDKFIASLELRRSFKSGLTKGEIIPYYQPIIDANTGEVKGLEALARWNHPTRGILTPYFFQEMLEDPEISGLIGKSMLENITKQMSEWKSKGIDVKNISINISTADLLNPTFSINILSKLTANALKPEDLTIEVTENCMFGEKKGMFIKQLEQLRLAGCSIALDDFGTGYSSITQIKELPCTNLKIDKSFVDEAIECTADRSIISALVKLGQTIGFDITAEGVETLEQLQLLKELGCHHLQGYYYSKPIPACEVGTMIDSMNNNSAKKIAEPQIA